MGKESGRAGPDPTVIDWDQVKGLCTMQCTKDEISAFLGVHHDTLMRASRREHGCCFGDLRQEWAQGGKCSLRRKQWKLADKSTAMAIFLGKQMLGQRDDIRLNHVGAITHEIVHFGDGEAKTYEESKSDRNE